MVWLIPLLLWSLLGSVVPARAQSCTVTPTYYQQAQITWQMTPDALAAVTAYRIERQTNQAGPWQKVGQVSRTTLAFIDGTDTPLQPGATYGWQVTALYQLPEGVVAPSASIPAPECLHVRALDPPHNVHVYPSKP